MTRTGCQAVKSYHCVQFMGVIQPRHSWIRAGQVGMLQQSRYIIEINIGRFREHLRSGLLDAGQTRTVTTLLAEALDELDEFDRRRAITRPPTADQSLPPPRAV
jgi:hypothetical protein